MNAVIRWNPLREMEDIQRRMSSLWEGGPFRRSNLTNGEENITVPEWAPLVDVIEDEKEYVIKVELPEVKRDDVEVTVENDMLFGMTHQFFSSDKHLAMIATVFTADGFAVKTGVLKFGQITLARGLCWRAR